MVLASCTAICIIIGIFYLPDLLKYVTQRQSTTTIESEAITEDTSEILELPSDSAKRVFIEHSEPLPDSEKELLSNLYRMEQDFLSSLEEAQQLHSTIDLSRVLPVQRMIIASMETLATKKALTLTDDSSRAPIEADSSQEACAQLLDQLQQKQQRYEQILTSTTDTEVQTIISTAQQSAELQLTPTLRSCAEQ